VKGYPRSGCFAVFTKLHHAAADGASGNEISAVLHDLTPRWEEGQVAGEELPVDGSTSDIKLLLRAQINAIKKVATVIWCRK
jgi:hypothetical protein